jgi:hypothetical protein
VCYVCGGSSFHTVTANHSLPFQEKGRKSKADSHGASIKCKNFANSYNKEGKTERRGGGSHETAVETMQKSRDRFVTTEGLNSKTADGYSKPLSERHPDGGGSGSTTSSHNRFTAGITLYRHRKEAEVHIPKCLMGTHCPSELSRKSCTCVHQPNNLYLLRFTAPGCCSEGTHARPHFMTQFTHLVLLPTPPHALWHGGRSCSVLQLRQRRRHVRRQDGLAMTSR